jgi:hypothetical protein
LFNSDLDQSQSILKGCIAANPRDPLAASLSAAVPFYSFVGGRLRPHGHASMQDMILGQGIGVPPDIQQIGAMLARAKRLADVDLTAAPRNENAILALCIAEGVQRDVLVLVYRRWLAGLEHAQEASLQARRLLEVNAQAYDAYYVIGLSEYVLAQIPLLLRPFAKIPGIVGDRRRAVEFLEAVARAGAYLQDFARQMLVTIYVEQRMVPKAIGLLEDLVNDFPQNQGYRAELERLRSQESRANL